MQWTEYHGWQIRAARQRNWPPYLDYIGWGKLETADKIFMFNVEGNTLEQANERAKAEIDRRPPVSPKP